MKLHYWLMATTLDEPLLTRASLLHRLKDWRDEASWQDFFDTYWKLIHSVARKSGLNEAEAQDVVQETMISVSKQMPEFRYDRNTGSFKHWLLNLTRWRINDQLRKRAPNTAHLSGEDTSTAQEIEAVVDPASLHLDELWDAEWEKSLLNAAITKVKRKLDPQKYQIFDFCVHKEWDAAKVAQAFNIPVDQVYLAKHRVSELIKAEVDRLQNPNI